MLKHESLTKRIIGAAIEVHREIGPGLLESAYEACLVAEFDRRDIAFRRQVDIPVHYKDMDLSCGYRADMIVDETILLELKSIERLEPVHEAQLLTYLKLTRLNVGLLINFNVPVLKDGVRRRVL